MAARIWDDETEGDVWVIEPGVSHKDTDLNSTYSSDSETTVNSAETIQSMEAAGEPGSSRVPDT
jgi:hypothetical protein